MRRRHPPRARVSAAERRGISRVARAAPLRMRRVCVASSFGGPEVSAAWASPSIRPSRRPSRRVARETCRPRPERRPSAAASALSLAVCVRWRRPEPFSPSRAQSSASARRASPRTRQRPASPSFWASEASLWPASYLRPSSAEPQASAARGASRVLVTHCLAGRLAPRGAPRQTTSPAKESAGVKRQSRPDRPRGVAERWSLHQPSKSGDSAPGGVSGAS